ncbi:plasma protease C1 inhibitor-like [Acetobacter orientalis]|uniref:Plasma protease C1 inhibitor-like n=1 Tax=Acetobacter orientalis TaxID=146474 RepID=A0A2Z5ZKJ0_9PROT|nr:plasma protease C1 inhibitor-like [Acetobacter orientalis]
MPGVPPLKNRAFAAIVRADGVPQGMKREERCRTPWLC